MFASSLITDDNRVSAGTSNFDRYEFQNDRTNSQQVSSSGHASSSLMPQSDSWPHQSQLQRSGSTTSQTFTPSGQFDSNTWNFSSSNANTSGCGSSHGNSDKLFGSESILQQAVPGTLATPRGWHSEIVGSTSSTYKNDTDSQSTNDTSRNVYEKHEEYKTLNTTDGPPVIFSSSSETRRFLNELPPSSLITSNGINTRNSTFTEFKNTPVDESFEQNRNIVLTEEQRAAVANIDTQQPPPMIIRKKSTANDVMYQQNIFVRYLQPPTPPLPGPIIIREVHPPPPCPKSPIHVRQRPAPSRTPPPLIFRERPPPIPPRPPCQIIEKLLPPPPRPPRRLIVEQLGPCPPKPSDVIIERWLPYRRNHQRRIFYERVPTTYRPPSPNVLVMHGPPQARIHKEFINQGVSRVDPNYYLQHYGHEINSSQLHSQYAQIIDEATRTLPPPPLPSPPAHPNVEYRTYNPSDPNVHSHPPPSFISNIWERMKSAPPYTPLGSYPINDPPYNHPGQYPPNNQWNSSYPYVNQSPHPIDPRAVPSIAPPWSGHNYPSPPPYQSAQPTQTIQVQSDTELHRVLSGLTNGRVPTPLRAY